MYTRNSVNFYNIPNAIDNVLTVNLFDLNVYIVGIFKPHTNNNVDNAVLFTFISDFCQNKEIVLVGDISSPSLKWNMENITGSYVPEAEMDFFNIFFGIRIGTNYWSAN